MIVAEVTVFPVPGGPWMKTERLLQNTLDSINLTAVQLWKSWNAEFLGHLNLHGCCGNLVTKKLVEDVTRNTHLVNSKSLHSKLHAIVGSGLPDVVGGEVVGAFGRYRLVASNLSKFDGDLVGLIVWNLDNVSDALPDWSQFALVFQAHLVSNSKFDITKLNLWEDKACKMLIVQTIVPANDKTILGLSFLKLAIIVCLDFDKGSKTF
jgi:hypothetical protein